MAHGFETLVAGDRSARCYVAGADSPGTPGVLVLHPWWGLNDDVVAFADRLATAGFVALAPDLFDGRVADTIDGADALAGSADEDACDALVLAALDRLAERVGERTPIAALGFSFGAAWALWSPAKRAVAGTVVYYGTMTGPALAKASVPVLGHFAADDPYEPEENVAALEAALREAGRDVTVHRYPGTGHWFAEPSRTDAYDPAAAGLAWERTVGFLRRVLG